MKNTSDSTCQKMSSRRLVPGLLLLSITLLAGCKCNQGDQNQDRIDSLPRLQADSISQENRNASHQFTFDSLTTGWLSATMGGRKVDTAAFKNGRAPGSPDSSTAQGGDAATGQFPRHTIQGRVLMHRVFYETVLRHPQAPGAQTGNAPQTRHGRNRDGYSGVAKAWVRSPIRSF